MHRSNDGSCVSRIGRFGTSPYGSANCVLRGGCRRKNSLKKPAFIERILAESSSDYAILPCATSQKSRMRWIYPSRNFFTSNSSDAVSLLRPQTDRPRGEHITVSSRREGNSALAADAPRVCLSFATPRLSCPWISVHEPSRRDDARIATPQHRLRPCMGLLSNGLLSAASVACITT